jgi:hypothetical protein
MKRFPDVRFITATQAARLYRDKARGRKFTPDEIKALARAVTADVTFQQRDDYALSAAEVFAILNAYLAERSAGREPAAVAYQGTPYGPTNRTPALGEPVTTDWSQFTRTSIDVADFLSKQGRIPTAVWLGSTPVPPEAYLVALARVVGDLADGKSAPGTVEVGPARLATAANVAADAPNLWGWIIFPRGFRAPAMMELAKRQAWTLKPALLDSSAN